MADDYEDLNDVERLSDDELRGLVWETLAAHRALDLDDLTLSVRSGEVVLGGRVGTAEEREVAERVVTDTLGIRRFRNEIFVDPIRRATSPEAVDESLADDELRDGLLLGDRPVPLSPEVEDHEPSIEAQLQGTTDVHVAIEDAAAWVPPERETGAGDSAEDLERQRNDPADS